MIAEANPMPSGRTSSSSRCDEPGQLDASFGAHLGIRTRMAGYSNWIESTIC